jgi:hypothetical protein
MIALEVAFRSYSTALGGSTTASSAAQIWPTTTFVGPDFSPCSPNSSSGTVGSRRSHYDLNRKGNNHIIGIDQCTFGGNGTLALEAKRSSAPPSAFNTLQQR